MHPREGDATYQPYSPFGEAIYCVTRRDLALALLEAAEDRGVTVAFEHRCVDVDPTAGVVVIDDKAGGRPAVRPSCIIAADGCRSLVRRRLTALGWCESSEQVSTHGYTELPIPAARAAASGLRCDALHVWPRHELVAGAFAKADGSFTGSIHMPMTGSRSFAAVRDRESVVALFAEELPEVALLVPDLARRFLARRPNSMAAVRCRPWSAAGAVALIGDAAHAMLPHYGQGANAGLEDCEIFDDLVESHGLDWERVVEAFEAMRRPDTDAMTDLSDEHFLVLRDRVALPEYRLRARIERCLQRRFLREFVPLYSMITFSSMSYAEARRRDALQRRVVDELARDPGIEQILARLEREPPHDERFVIGAPPPVTGREACEPAFPCFPWLGRPLTSSLLEP
ncbi:MAG: FAD-dependent oxidoreductase [Vicinamibacterales bacterium]